MHFDTISLFCKYNVRNWSPFLIHKQWGCRKLKFSRLWEDNPLSTESTEQGSRTLTESTKATESVRECPPWTEPGGRERIVKGGGGMGV